MDSESLIVIPARGGSKGVPRKNLKLLAGRPLIHHCLTSACSVDGVTVVVSTEDEEIMAVAGEICKNVIERPAALSGDDIALDEVVVHAVEASEEIFGLRFGKILTIQPTSPFITAGSILEAVGALDEADSVISVTDDRHLRWKESDGRPVPMFAERVNRQWMEPCWVESGGIIACRRELIDAGSRIGENVYLLKLDATEGHDIDTPMDWSVAESIAMTPSFAFRVLGNSELGLGHAYRALTIADRLPSKPIFIVDSGSGPAADLIKSRHYEVVVCDNVEDLLVCLDARGVDIVVNDVLDTTKDEIGAIVSDERLVVNFEDLGEGSKLADLTINALYEQEVPEPNQRYGWPWVCLRDEFVGVTERDVEGSHVLITFGGTDPRNLSSEALSALSGMTEGGLGSKIGDLHVKLVLGPGNPRLGEVSKLGEELAGSFASIEVMQSVSRISGLMRAADFAITSNGRTVFELAACNTPTITISQNEREDLHTFSSVCRGTINLGWSESFPDDSFAEAIEKMLGEDGDANRERMRSELGLYDLSLGTDRVINEIESHFRNKRRR